MDFVKASRLGTVCWAVLTFLSAFAVTAVLVLLTIQLCRKHGWVCKPHADRWHKGTPAFFGGVPLFVGFASLSIAFIPRSDYAVWRLIGIASLMFVLGLCDDIYRLTPAWKLAGQLLLAGFLVSMGVFYPVRASMTVNGVVSVLWLVGITNAFNLLDNMDGLSAGIALIAAGYSTVFAAMAGYRDQAVIVALAAGAIAGFLVFNFRPARIFMGDSGSLLIGFVLGAASILQVTHAHGASAWVLTPAMLLAIPIFDTLFVSVTRSLRGQPISQGGMDHSSHRLVRLGLQEQRAVLLLYALSAGSGAVALLTRHSSSAAIPGLIGVWLFLLLFGIHLFQDEVKHDVLASDTANPLSRRLFARDMLVFLLDPLAIALSFHLVFGLRLGGKIPVADSTLLLRCWPIVVAIKVLALWICRAFRHSWWRGSISDLYRLGSATLIGEFACALVLSRLYRFDGFLGSVFLFDAVITMILLLIIRRSYALFRFAIYKWRGVPAAQRRVFILGTSAHAEMALQFLREHSIECAGFIDTNGGADLRRYVFGRPVLGRLDDLGWLSKQHGVFEVVLPDCERILWSRSDFQLFCRRRQLRLMKLGLHEDRREENARLRVG
jgi:UDP-GlcNAc:undecaprenyl-phosphate/decaprenyl-phosphate GlcNAc-1-phosphate transferase